MKIVITGHKRGIGKAIFDYFNHSNNEIIGFSLSDGYDISTTKTRTDILNELID
mgnify:CR=1 FL=1